MGRGVNNVLLQNDNHGQNQANTFNNSGKLIILCGVPGSGKSTWVKNNQKHCSVVSSDSIRLELFESLVEANRGNNQEKNALVFKIFYKRITDLLKAGETVIADATNLRARDRKKLAALAESESSATKLVVFKNTELARINNLNRPEDQIVPDLVMEKMINRFQSSLTNLKNESYTEIVFID
jgi:predicted kinase